MEKIKQVWTLAKANPKISIAVVIVIVVIYFLVNQSINNQTLKTHMKLEDIRDEKTNVENKTIAIKIQSLETPQMGKNDVL